MAQPVPSHIAQAVVALGNEMRTKYPRAFSKCHVEGDPEKGDFIILFAQEAKKRDIAAPSHHVGLNGKRGTDEMSLDVLSFMDRNGSITDVRVVDVVVGAGAPGASITFNDVTSFGPGKYIDPNTKDTVFDYDNDDNGNEPLPPTECRIDEIKPALNRLSNQLVAIETFQHNLVNQLDQMRVTMNIFDASLKYVTNRIDATQATTDDTRRRLEDVMNLCDRIARAVNA